MRTLIPSAFDPAWTRLDGVVFNAYLDHPIELPTNNPSQSTTVTVAISAGSGGSLAVLPLNKRRNLLIIQNNSTATSPDVAPTFYIGFGRPAVIGASLAFAPAGSANAGGGIILDVTTPSDAIYLLIGPSVNTNGTVVTQGFIIEGTKEKGG